jgi:GntR family transcriptional regulator
LEAWGDDEPGARHGLRADRPDHAGRPNRPSLVDIAEAAVRDWLAPGHYRRGDRLPPEYELAAMLGISRGTLRSALRRLELTGEIVRRQGSGTFVGRLTSSVLVGPEHGRIATWSPRSCLPEMEIQVSGLRIEQRAPGARAAEVLDIAPRRRTTVISRELSVEGAPSALSRDAFHPRLSLLPTEEMYRLLSAGVKMGGLLEMTEHAISFTRTTISPRLVEPDEPDGRQLVLGQPTACLEVEEIVYDSLELPMLYSCDVFTPGGIQIEVIESVGVPHPAPVIARPRAKGQAAREAGGTRLRS